MNELAIQYLLKVDKKLGRIIDKVGPCTLSAKNRHPPFRSLAESIIYQQLSTKAAGTILRRFKDLFPGKKFPSPTDILKTDFDTLRSAGLSRSKVLSIVDLAEKTASGIVPTSRKIKAMTDQEIVDCLIQIRGVGPWTIEMLMIFHLGRQDVLPTSDFAIRKAFANIYNQGLLPQVQDIVSHGERWKPYRTTAAWYLWQSLNLK